MVRKVEVPSDADAVRMNILSVADEKRYFETCLRMDKTARLIASPDQRAYRDLHDFGRLMIQQGCRPEEYLELRKEHVDLMNRWVYVVKGKTKAARRRLKLTTESAEILARRNSEPGPFVFPSPRNPQKHRGPTWRVHYRVLEACGLAFVPYDFRHTFATCAGADGMALPVLAATLGHANLRSVMKYIHITGDHIDDGMVKLEQLRSVPTCASSFDPGGRNSQPAFEHASSEVD
jgi:integrase